MSGQVCRDRAGVLILSPDVAISYCFRQRSFRKAVKPPPWVPFVEICISLVAPGCLPFQTEMPAIGLPPSSPFSTVLSVTQLTQSLIQSCLVWGQLTWNQAAMIKLFYTAVTSIFSHVHMDTLPHTHTCRHT